MFLILPIGKPARTLLIMFPKDGMVEQDDQQQQFYEDVE